MIIGNINNTKEIEKLHPLFKNAFDWLRSNWDTIHDSGKTRIELTPDCLFANIDTAQMKSAHEQIFEVHHKYIDIHIPINTAETIGWRPTYQIANNIQEYDHNLDRAFYADIALSYFTINPGEFIIMYPHDAHAPIIGKGEIKKICMKIKVEY